MGIMQDSFGIRSSILFFILALTVAFATIDRNPTCGTHESSVDERIKDCFYKYGEDSILRFEYYATKEARKMDSIIYRLVTEYGDSQVWQTGQEGLCTTKSTVRLQTVQNFSKVLEICAPHFHTAFH